MRTKQAYLMLACAVVTSIALLYGVSPRWCARSFPGVEDLGQNLAHILRAIMELYMALGLSCLIAATSGRHRNAAVLTTVVVAAGLASGSVVSFVADGLPARLLVIYAVAELTIVPVAYWVYRLPEA